MIHLLNVLSADQTYPYARPLSSGAAAGNGLREVRQPRRSRVRIRHEAGVALAEPTTNIGHPGGTVSHLQILTRPWEDVDSTELAALTLAAGRLEAPGTGDRALAKIATWLDNGFGGHPRVAVLAREEGRLAGWLMITLQKPSTAEINPRQLGGHPIVTPDSPDQKVAAALLAEAIHWGRAQGLGRIEMVTPWTGSDKLSTEQRAWYASLGFQVKLTYVEMICHLSRQAAPVPTIIPAGLELRSLQEAKEEQLYACYHAAFAAGDAKFFRDQSESERRPYFDSLGLGKARHEKASVLLTRGQQVVGFAYVLPHGSSNRHISCMCVHPEYQGQGLGKLLLRLVMQQVAKRGCKTVTLGTETGMRAFGLYHQHGFRVSGGSTVYVHHLAD